MSKNKKLKSPQRVPYFPVHEASIFDYEGHRDISTFLSEFLIVEDSVNRVQRRADIAADYTTSKLFESFQIEKDSMNCKMLYMFQQTTVDYATSELSFVETFLMNSKTQYRPEIEADYPMSEPPNNPFNTVNSRNSGQSRSRKRKTATDSMIHVSSSHVDVVVDPIKRKRIAEPNRRVRGDTVKFQASYKGYFAELVKDLTAMSLCDELMALEDITDEEYDAVRSHTTNKERNRTLLLILCKRELSRSKFTVALRKSGNGHLVPMFFPK